MVTVKVSEFLPKTQTAAAGNYLLWRESDFVVCTWKVWYNMGYYSHPAEVKLNIKPDRRKKQNVYLGFESGGSF